MDYSVDKLTLTRAANGIILSIESLDNRIKPIETTVYSNVTLDEIDRLISEFILAKVTKRLNSQPGFNGA